MRHLRPLIAAGLLLAVLGLSGGVAAGPAHDALNRGDHETAVRIWRAEAETGNPTSQVMLGHMFMSGEGVQKDPEEAVRWFRMAAEQGSGMGRLLVADAYRSGVGVKQDDAEAARWYLLAGEDAYGTAHFILAQLYARGQGVPQDFAEAYKWYTINASTDFGRNAEAYKARVIAERDAMAADAKMTPEDIAEAEKLAREWKPKR